jgi:uncharacterized protein YvpB
MITALAIAATALALLLVSAVLAYAPRSTELLTGSDSTVSAVTDLSSVNVKGYDSTTVPLALNHDTAGSDLSGFLAMLKHGQQVTNYVQRAIDTLGIDGVRSEYILDVPLVSQFPDYPTGCELASVAMLLQYHGRAADLAFVADTIPRSSDGDPQNGFVGDPTVADGYGWYGGWYGGWYYGWYYGGGWTIYPEALTAYLDAQLGTSGSVVLTGASLDTLKTYVRGGKPVIIWLIDQEIGPHSVVLSGYDTAGFYVNDPYGIKDRYIESDAFVQAWEDYDTMALSFTTGT